MKTKASKTKKEEEHPYHHLFKAISLIKNTDEAQQFLTDLCTPAELQAMADRWLVVASIKAGKPYRKIHEETGVSVTTIGRVARFMSQGAGGYHLLLTRMEHQQHVATTPKDRTTEKRSAQ